MIAFMGLGRFTRLLGLDLGHLLCNSAVGFQHVMGVLKPQEIVFRQPEKLHRRKSVSPVMSRVPLTMAWMRLPGTRMV